MKSLSHVRLFVTPWTVAYQAPPSMGFSKQEYWNGLLLSYYIYKQKKKQKTIVSSTFLRVYLSLDVKPSSIIFTGLSPSLEWVFPLLLSIFCECPLKTRANQTLLEQQHWSFLLRCSLFCIEITGFIRVQISSHFATLELSFLVSGQIELYVCIFS